MKILFIGGDMRMNYAAEKLSEANTVERLGTGSFPLPAGEFDAIVLPLPLTKDGETIFAPLSEQPIPFDVIGKFLGAETVIFAGGSSQKLAGICEKRSLCLVNYFAGETLTLQNAALTAEAACVLLSQSTDGALLGSKALITGYGRISRFLAERLRAFGCTPTIAARREVQRTQARLDGFSAVSIENIPESIPEFNYIANTAPAQIFTEEFFTKMRKDCVFAELATVSPEPARSLAEKYGVKYIFASGLPGKYFPKTAGEFIADEITRLLDTARFARPIT